MGYTSFLVFSCPNLLIFCFPELFFFWNCYLVHVFRESCDFLFLWVFLVIFSVPYFGLASDHGNSFPYLLEE